MPFKPLPCRKVERALELLGFTKAKQTSGTSHQKWEAVRGGHKFVVSLACHHGEVRDLDVKSIIGQAGVSKKEFWKTIERC